MSCTGNSSCTCGCCAGTSVQTPQALTNLPGLSSISYRVGRWATFKESMLARLSSSDYPALAAQGVWMAGTFFSLSGLARIRLTTRPAVLRFSMYESTGENTTYSSMRVLVPQGHEAEAEHLRQLYQTEAIDGVRQARERLLHPPEPL